MVKIARGHRPRSAVVIRGRVLQWAVVPLWVAAAVIHVVWVPFPPWSARAGGASLLALFLTYGTGLFLFALSLITPHATARILHRSARAVFLAGGVVTFCLDGRPCYLASTWGLFLLAGRLHPEERHPEATSAVRRPPS